MTSISKAKASFLLAVWAWVMLTVAFPATALPLRSTQTRTTVASSARATLAAGPLFSTTGDNSVGSNANELFPLKKGSTVALVTPFDADTGAVRYDELERLLQWHVESGTQNLCILGTTGEANVVTMDERTRILQMAVEQVKGKMTIMAGTGTIDPMAVKSMTQHAADVGCDASLVVTPYYVKPPQRCLVQHFVDLADHGGLPVVMYNVPGRTAVDMTDESIALAAQHNNIVALKDATGNVDRLISLLQTLEAQNVARQDLLCFSGDDGTTLDFLLNGGDGCISVTANVVPATMARIVQSVLEEGDDAKAQSLNDPLLGLHKQLFCESNPIPTKWVLQRMGRISSDFCRAPLAAMDSAMVPRVQGAMQEAGLL